MACIANSLEELVNCVVEELGRARAKVEAFPVFPRHGQVVCMVDGAVVGVEREVQAYVVSVARALYGNELRLEAARQLFIVGQRWEAMATMKQVELEELKKCPRGSLMLIDGPLLTAPGTVFSVAVDHGNAVGLVKRIRYGARQANEIVKYPYHAAEVNINELIGLGEAEGASMARERARYLRVYVASLGLGKRYRLDILSSDPLATIQEVAHLAVQFSGVPNRPVDALAAKAAYAAAHALARVLDSVGARLVEEEHKRWGRLIIKHVHEESM